jgi:hypothetical protein
VRLLFGVATARITCDLLFSKFTETILHYWVKQISSIISARIEENGRKFKDFRMYFETNRIFLSPGTCSEIYKILSRYDLMEWAMQIFLDDIPEEFYGIARSSIKKLFGIDMSSDLERPEILSLTLILVRQLYEEVNTQAEKLETLYKSVAEAQ